MYNIYINHENILFWLNSIGQIDPGSVTQDYEFWRNRQQGYNIALIELLEVSPGTEALVDRVCNDADLVVLYNLEFTDITWYKHYDRPNVCFFMPGDINFELQHAQKFHYNNFFNEITTFYRKRRSWLNHLTTSKDKPLWFDVLLGRKKPHRELIYNTIDPSKNFVTYFKDTQDKDILQREPSEFSWPTELLSAVDRPVDFTMQQVYVDNDWVSVSQVIPVDIYNQTHYTIVAETQADNEWIFCTEKIAKPMLAGRVFLVASGQYYLRHLRNLGFKTFDGIIDESYDVQPNMETRVELMLEQARWLMLQNPQEIYEKTQSICEHNRTLMLETDWLEQMITSSKQILLNKVQGELLC